MKDQEQARCPTCGAAASPEARCPECGVPEPTFIAEPPQETMSAEQLAKDFHETYERLAPKFGYETRKDSAKPWNEVPENNRKLMTAVCAEILSRGYSN